MNLKPIQKTEPDLHDLDQREAVRDYLFDMIAQMARLARKTGDPNVAVHLEAIIAARRAVAEDRSR